MNKQVISEIKKLLIILIGTVIYGVGVSRFLDPNSLAPGGVTGIAIILNRLTGLQTGTGYLLINIPIMILGLVKFGWRFMAKTAYAVVLSSAFTNYFAAYGALTDDLLMASLAGAICMAVGIGLIFRAGATTGGTDIIIKLLRRKFRHLKTGFLFLCFDIVIVTISGFNFRDLNIALYALLTVFVTGKAMDMVLYGGDEAKQIFIITESPEAVGKRLLTELEVGYTYLSGEGGYSGRRKKVIFCVVPQRTSPAVLDIVKKEDPEAFMIISSANEIYGEGYKDIFEEAI